MRARRTAVGVARGKLLPGDPHRHSLREVVTTPADVVRKQLLVWQ